MCSWDGAGEDGGKGIVFVRVDGPLNTPGRTDQVLPGVLIIAPPTRNLQDDRQTQGKHTHTPTAGPAKAGGPSQSLLIISLPK